MYIPCMQSLFLVEVNVSSETHVGKTTRLGKKYAKGDREANDTLKKGVPIELRSLQQQKSMQNLNCKQTNDSFKISQQSEAPCSCFFVVTSNYCSKIIQNLGAFFHTTELPVRVDEGCRVGT